MVKEISKVIASYTPGDSVGMQKKRERCEKLGRGGSKKNVR